MANHSSRPPGRRRRAARFGALATGVGVALILVFALVFSIAFGSQGVARQAEALHNADEALRAVSTVRFQVGLAAHLVTLRQQFGVDTDEAIERAVGEARIAITDLEAAAADLQDRPAVADASAWFVESANAILAAVEERDHATATAAAAGALEERYRSTVGSIVAERDERVAALASSSDVMGRVGDIARFLVAFLVPTSVILVYHELSKRRSRQAELEVRLESEQEIGKARDEFVANASHELRTPLTSIIGLAHILEEDEVVTSSPTASEMINLIIGEAHDLNRMVDDLLTTARLDAGALRFQPENLSVLDEVRETIEPLRRAGAHVSIDCHPALVFADRLRMRQVVRNLLSNAAKYGGPAIAIVGRIADGWYELRVADDGDGIPKALEERLFERFLHEGTMPLVLGSVGLGLSIVRALAEGMGGSVRYQRVEGWTHFVVRLPLGDQSAEAPRYREPQVFTPRAAAPDARLERVATAVAPAADDLPPPPSFSPSGAAAHRSTPV